MRHLASLGLVLCVLCACKSTDPAEVPEDDPRARGTLETDGSETPPDLLGAAPPDVATPVAEAPSSRRERVQTLERSIDNWWNHRIRQKFSTQESLETMLRTYTRDHLDAIIGDLRYGSIRHRRIAAAALGFSGSQRAVAPLYEALGDAYPDVVEHALLGISLLLRPGPKASGPHVMAREDMPGERSYASDEIAVDLKRLLPFLQNPDPDLRTNASLAILHALRNGQEPSDETVLALINAREDASDNTRVHVIAALGHSDSELAFPHLVRALLDDPVELVRIRAALGLARLRNKGAAPYLIEVLAKENEALAVKEAARDALRLLLDEPGLPSLRPEDWRPIARSQGLL